MNKTVNINLGGMPFTIDDVAFGKLSAYINAVKAKFNDHEIVEDIEARIAEMFYDNLKDSGRTIISMTDVNAAIATMGRPEEFEQGYTDETTAENATNSSSNNQYTNYNVGKRLMRDSEDRLLGGVISGIAQYLGLDNPTWARVAFFFLPMIDFFFIPGAITGTMWFIYILLWIILPKAVSSTEKMQMRGEPVNLDNIENNLKNEFNSIKKNGNTEGRDFIEQLVKVIGKILIGIGLFFLGIMTIGLLIALFFGLFGVGIASPFLSQYIFASPWMMWATIIGVILMLFAPAIFILTLLSKLFFKTKINMPAIGLTALGAFIIGLLLSATSIGSTAKDFRTRATDSSTTTLYNEPQELFIYGNETNDQNKIQIGVLDDNSSSINENVDLYILPSLSDKVELTVKKMVRGKNNEIAEERLSSMDYNYSVKGNELHFDEFYTINKDLFRAQAVKIYLKVPENSILNFDKSSYGVLQNADFDKYYSDYQLEKGKRWKVKKNVLVQLDTEGNEILSENDFRTDDFENLSKLSDLDNVIEQKLREKGIQADIDLDIEMDENQNVATFEALGKPWVIRVKERDDNGKIKRVEIKFGKRRYRDIEIN